ATLSIPAGTWISVRVNEALSSDHNQPGDLFTATLSQPVIANGFVVARRGQVLSGHVVEAGKSGKSGTSRPALDVSELRLADGQRLQMRTQLMQYSGGSATGRNVATVATTTGIGAAVGAAADGGLGAGVGAVAGAGVGALLMHGRPTVVYPEALLNFKTLEP